MPVSARLHLIFGGAVKRKLDDEWKVLERPEVDLKSSVGRDGGVYWVNELRWLDVRGKDGWFGDGDDGLGIRGCWRKDVGEWIVAVGERKLGKVGRFVLMNPLGLLVIKKRVCVDKRGDAVGLMELCFIGCKLFGCVDEIVNAQVVDMVNIQSNVNGRNLGEKIMMIIFWVGFLIEN